MNNSDFFVEYRSSFMHRCHGTPPDGGGSQTGERAMNAYTSSMTNSGSSDEISVSRWSECPAPAVIVKQVANRPRTSAHIVVFANEKGGVGKSTLAFHSSIALAYSGAKVLALDLDRRQCSLSQTLDIRAGTGRALKANLRGPTHVALDRQSPALLDQEILRMGSDSNFIVIDLPGADSATARYAIAIADTLVTPVGNSPFDIQTLGRISPVTRSLSGAGSFGQLVADMRRELEEHGIAPFDWLVLKNRGRISDRRLELQTDEALAMMASSLPFRLGTGLPERLGFRDLLSFGLTYLDLGFIPGVGRRRSDIEKSIIDLLLQLELPGFEARPETIARTRQRSVMRTDDAAAYALSLHEHMARLS